MQQLGAQDANFLYSETTRNPNHVASVQKFELPQATTSSDFVAGLKGFMAARLHLVPYLTRKIRFSPGNLDHPFWISDENFDIDNHIVEIRLPIPGDTSQLELKIAELHSEQMDRNIPLWKLHVITGLEDGCVAFYNQVHHACIDGMAGQAATQILMDKTPDHPTQNPPRNFPEKEDPGLIDLYVLSVQNLLTVQIDNASKLFDGMEAFARMAQRAIDPSKSFGALIEPAPSTRFNRTIGKERSYAAGELLLADIKAMGNTMGCKVNDVFMAICAGGLRKYLQRHHELPVRSLIAGCPVSLRKPGDTALNNQVTMMSVSLATDIADPRLRLLAIRDSADTAKEVTADLADGYNTNIAFPGMPLILTAATILADISNAADFIPMPINVVISNVPGPREMLYSNGARMLTHYPVSIPTQGIGLNITVQSYCGTLYFGLTACRKALPDAPLLRDDMMSAYRELKSLFSDEVPSDNVVFENFRQKKVTELKADTSVQSVVTPGLPIDRVALG